jgi:hypothetical protein
MLFIFNFHANPDPAFRSYADPEPDSASKNNADTCGSGTGFVWLTTGRDMDSGQALEME